MDTHSRNLAITKALTLMTEGQGKMRACREAGISHKTLDRHLAKNPALRTGFIEGREEELEAQLTELREANRIVTDRLIRMARTGTNENGEALQPRDLIALSKQLSTVIEALDTQVQATKPKEAAADAGNSAAEIFLRNLNGPKRRHEISVISHRVEMSFRPEPEPADVVDAQVDEELPE